MCVLLFFTLDAGLLR